MAPYLQQLPETSPGKRVPLTEFCPEAAEGWTGGPWSVVHTVIVVLTWLIAVISAISTAVVTLRARPEPADVRNGGACCLLVARLVRFLIL